jgi:hypothetical protein
LGTWKLLEGNSSAFLLLKPITLALAKAFGHLRVVGRIGVMPLVPAEERLRTLSEVHKRLKPGAPFIVAHHSFPQEEKALWLRRYAAFASSSGISAEKAEDAAAEIGRRLPVLSPDQPEALMREAGFSDVSLFYAGFTFRELLH